MIERLETRVLAFLHVSFAGIFGFSRDVMVGEACDLRLLDARRLRPGRPRASRSRARDQGSGRRAHQRRPTGCVPLQLALEAAELAELPLMCHIDEPPPQSKRSSRCCGPGDILTHCFRPPQCPALPDGGSAMACWRRASAAWRSTSGMAWARSPSPPPRRCSRRASLPDVISSDVHALCVDGPAFDNLATMSKFLGLGMPLAEIVRAVTATPASLLAAPDLGTFARGANGDATVLRDRGGLVRGRRMSPAPRADSSPVSRCAPSSWAGDSLALTRADQSATPNRRVRLRL